MSKDHGEGQSGTRYPSNELEYVKEGVKIEEEEALPPTLYYCSIPIPEECVRITSGIHIFL